MTAAIRLSKALEPFIANWPWFLGLFALLIVVIPSNVLNQGLTRWIHRHQETRLDPTALGKAFSILDQIHRSTDRKAAARANLAANSYLSR